MMKQWEGKGGYVELSDEEKKAHRLKLLITRACPNCAALIEKNGGCPHMKCGSCNNEVRLFGF
jgi:ariadne-1